jgi:hypothetical protein
MAKTYGLAKVRLTDAVLLAAIPPFSYLLLWLYYQPQFEHYNVPVGLFRPNSMQALLFATGLTIAFVLAYALAQLVSRLIPAQRPVLLRLRRLVGVMLIPEFLFGSIAIFKPGYLPPLEYFLRMQEWLSPIMLYLVISDFVFPALRHRNLKGWRAKLSQKADLEMYQKPSSYALSRARVVLPLLLILIAFVAYTMGTRATRGRHSYLIINSTPQQIVLINYGDKMLTAEVEQRDSLYLYRPNFRLLDASNLDEHTFTYVPIDKERLKKANP